jgi:5-methylcytosine-specific restriction endonuclease McrA
MLPQFQTLEDGDHAGERQNTEGFHRRRKARAGYRHFRGETGSNAHVTSTRKGRFKNQEVSMAVFVLDKRKKPLMPCSERRARILLSRGRARIHKMVPFTIRLVDRLVENSVLQPVRLKLDPGSKTTGIALVRESENVDEKTGEIQQNAHVLFLAELSHRGQIIRDKLFSRSAFRRRRRVANLRYRAPRFNNRRRPQGWLAPSLQHRVNTTCSWVSRLRKWTPVTAISQELVKFDTQKMQNPEISDVEYQHGTLQGIEIKEYLLEKWGHKCAYCGAENVPLEIEHIQPKSKGGSNRVSNLTIACHSCNQRKDKIPIEQFLAKKPELAHKILAQTKESLRDAAAVNSTRWSLYNIIKATGLEIETASGGRTKWNRQQLNIPKTHCLDAACVGCIDTIQDWKQPILQIKAMGRGRYQRTQLTKYGFPHGYLMRSKSAFGFQTGDMVRAEVTTGKKIGKYLGRVAIRASGSFNIQTRKGLVQKIHHHFCRVIQRSDGYGYAWTKMTVNGVNHACQKT